MNNIKNSNLRLPELTEQQNNQNERAQSPPNEGALV